MDQQAEYYKPYTYQFAAPFENLTTESQKNIREWMQLNWTQSIAYSALYVILIFLGKWFMRDRPRYELRLPLVMWSGALAVFSILGTIRFVPELVYMVYNYGIKSTLKDRSYYQGVAGTWAILFVFSKAVELGDTAFIILRKQQLIFLHWYHHITVMLYCFGFYAEMGAPSRWFTCMNYSVHAIMYSYYTLRAARFRVPKFVSILITSMQITQMIIGLSLYFWMYWMRYYRNDHSALVSDDAITCGFTMYATYFVLFVNFFFNTYIRPAKAQPPVKMAPVVEQPPFHESEDASSIDRPLNKEEIAEKSEMVTDIIRTVASINRNGYLKKDL